MHERWGRDRAPSTSRLGARAQRAPRSSVCAFAALTALAAHRRDDDGRKARPRACDDAPQRREGGADRDEQREDELVQPAGGVGVDVGEDRLKRRAREQSRGGRKFDEVYTFHMSCESISRLEVPRRRGFATRLSEAVHSGPMIITERLQDPYLI